MRKCLMDSRQMTGSSVVAWHLKQKVLFPLLEFCDKWIQISRIPGSMKITETRVKYRILKKLELPSPRWRSKFCIKEGKAVITFRISKFILWASRRYTESPPSSRVFRATSTRVKECSHLFFVKIEPSQLGREATSDGIEPVDWLLQPGRAMANAAPPPAY